jgi:hypothetical protein
MIEQNDFHHLSFDIRQSSFLEFSGFQLLAKKANLLFYRAVLFDSSLDTINRMQNSGMVAVK